MLDRLQLSGFLLKKMGLYYTTINHGARIKFKISLVDYCIADTIYHLSNSPKSKTPSWCYASKNYFAKILKIDRATVFRSLALLLDKKLIEKNPEKQRQLRMTKKWYDNVIMDEQSQNATVDRNSRKMRLKQSQNETVSTKPNRRKMRPYNYNKDNISNSSVLKRISSWAYNKASTLPSCKRKVFDRVVVKAIKKHGHPAVLKLFLNEVNAIRFLTKLKALK